MRATVKYIPSSEPAKVIWLNNFRDGVGTYATTLGLTPAEVNSVNKDAVFYQFLENRVVFYKNALSQIIGYKNLAQHANGTEHLEEFPSFPAAVTPPDPVPEGIFDRVVKMVNRIKSSPGYNQSIGEALGIIGSSSIIDVRTLQPVLKIKMDVGRPHIKCARNRTQAIDLFVDRHDGHGFILIGRLTKPEYVDNAPAPSALTKWDYKAIYVLDNETVGEMSLIQSVIVGGV